MNSKRFISFSLGFVFVFSSILSLSQVFAFDETAQMNTYSFVEPNYTPGYIPDPEMVCENVYGSNTSAENALANLNWGNFTRISLFNTQYEYTIPDADVMDLDENDIIQLDYSSYGFHNISDKEAFKQKVRKAYNRGVKFLLNGQYTNEEESKEFFELFGLDIKQDDDYHQFAPENQVITYEFAGFTQLKTDPSIKATSYTLQPFYDVNELEYQVVYETIEDNRPTVIEFPVENSKSVIRLLGDIIITAPQNEDPYYDAENINHSYEYIARLYSCANNPDYEEPEKVCLDFENLPATIKNKTEIKSQFKKDTGFSFKLKQPANTSVVCPVKPQIAMAGGRKPTAFTGYNNGSDTIDPLHADRIGNNFLTDDGKAQFSACTLEVSIDKDFMQNTVTFDIIDINKHGGKQERFLIKAFDAEGNVIKEDTAGGLVPEKGTELKVNGLATEVKVSATKPIAKIQIIPRGNIPAWGVAYDNFCTVRN